MVKIRRRIVDTDILIIGGGMSGCGAAWEARYWCRKCRIVIVEKANINRSGAVAMGLSAINTYMGMKCKENTPEDFVRYARTDLMGIIREDLIYDVARHVDSTVHLFEQWGLPIWPNPKTGCYVREGRWQVLIHGESYKAIVAEAAQKAASEVYNRVMVTHLLKDPHNPNRVVGAVGFNVRDGTFYVFRAKAVIVASGGGSLIWRPRAQLEGHGRAWYPPWASASAYGLLIEAGAVMTMMENRFSVPRFKDAYGPVGAYQLYLGVRITDAKGEDPFNYYKEEFKRLYNGKGNYVEAFPTPTNLRVLAQRRALLEGKGPILIRTEEKVTSPEAEAVAYEDFLDMTISQVVVWAGQNFEPSKEPYEIMATEPYLMGSHAALPGAWASGPEDIAPKKIEGVPDERGYQYFWGYNRMTTLDGVFCAGDACGASPHKFSSGSFTEGRIAAKAAVRYIMENDVKPEIDWEQVNQLEARIYAPIERWEEGKNLVVINDRFYYPVAPHMMWWRQGLTRLQKIMDEYFAGWATQYVTNEEMMLRGLKYLLMLKEDFERFAVAEDFHQLQRTWELWHRILAAEASARHMLFRKETRWPGYYIRADYPYLDDENWHVFVNSRYDARSGKWEIWKVPVIHIVPFP